MKNIMLAAISASAIALFATDASAQATPFYNSPAEARTSDVAPAARTSATHPLALRYRHIDAYAAQPTFGIERSNATNKHTVHIRDY